MTGNYDSDKDGRLAITYPNGDKHEFRGTVPGGRYIRFYDFDRIHKMVPKGNREGGGK